MRAAPRPEPRSRRRLATRSPVASTVTLDWDGHSDMIPAVEPQVSHAVRRPVLRAQKEALRARLYSREDRQRRDAVLAEIAGRAAQLPLSPKG